MDLRLKYSQFRTIDQGLQLLVVRFGHPEHDAEDGEGVLGPVPLLDGPAQVVTILAVEVHKVQLK